MCRSRCQRSTYCTIAAGPAPHRCCRPRIEDASLHTPCVAYDIDGARARQQGAQARAQSGHPPNVSPEEASMVVPELPGSQSGHNSVNLRVAGRGSWLHGREGSVCWSQIHLARRASPARWRSRTPMPLSWIGRQTRGQLTLHWPPSTSLQGLSKIRVSLI